MDRISSAISANTTVDFSKRELECLQLTLRGKTAKQIGVILGLSSRTVEQYLGNLKYKMGVTSKSALIECALKQFGLSIYIKKEIV